MKKIIFSLSILLITQTTAFAFYSDVPIDHRYYDPIKNLYDLDLLPKDTLFHPDETLKRGDLYKLILTYGNADLSTEVDLQYTDANKTVAKHRVLSTMFKTLGIGTTYFFDKNDFPFIDIRPNSDIAATAMKAGELGIFEETNQNLFKMAKRVTKAEAADYLYKIHEYTPNITISVETSPSYNNVEKELLENEAFSILLDIWSALKTNFFYKDDLDDKELVFGAIKGLVGEVDDIHTAFQEADDAKKFLESLSNEYEGVGMMIELIENNITIISPFKASPAEEAGLKPNDIIIEVDGESVIGRSLEAVVNKIKGPAGTKVEIKVLRGNEELDFNIEREFILYPNIQYELLEEDNKNIAHIEIITFGNTAYSDFLEAAEALIEENPEGFIIDVRSNPGGYMEQAISIVSLFTDEIIPVVMLEYSDGTTEEYKTNGDGLLKDYETVVLINEGSASASEILAGALQDYEKAKIIGTKSFGKGSVQQLNEYSDGSIFKYTISKWLTPNGTDIDQKGITPDKVVENTNTNDKQLEAALKEF